MVHELSEKGKNNLHEMKLMIGCLDSLVDTDRDTRIATGLDLENKLVFTNKGKLIETFIKAYGITMDYGANKYHYSNFEAAPYVYEDVLDCLMRHWISFCANGEDVDVQSKQLHISHIVARCAIATMKADRNLQKNNPDATRFIGWDANEVESICNEYLKEVFPDTLTSPIAPKEIPYSAHVTSEMIRAVVQSPFFEAIDKYSFRSWCKTFELALISFIVSSINGETDEDKAKHAKILLWLAINIFYLESINKSTDHIGYLSLNKE